jgi:hypothetical protein
MVAGFTHVDLGNVSSYLSGFIRLEVEWPDGTIEQVDIFKAHFEAVNWLRTQSQSWLQSRTAL